MTRVVHPKVVSATAASAATSVLLGYALHLPKPVAESLVVLATFAGGWFKRSAPSG
jgi:hypothetical protein